jgi:hypothetical protein
MQLKLGFFLTFFSFCSITGFSSLTFENILFRFFLSNVFDSIGDLCVFEFIVGFGGIFLDIVLCVFDSICVEEFLILRIFVLLFCFITNELDDYISFFEVF